MKKLPEVWFLRFKTIEVFNELCLPYAPSFVFLDEAKITNKDNREKKLGNYYYLTNGTIRGEEITYEEFKESLQDPIKIKKENYTYLIKLFKQLNIN